jgi:putative membrane protein insertion efficiency factor
MIRGLTVGIIRCYQRFVSPLFGSRCRFYPSCSTYGITAVQRHGVIKGLGLTIVRTC